jgi:hypothetical protein
LVVIAAFSSAQPVRADESSPPFRPLFDGKTLDGWTTPDPTYWSVEDAAITAIITPKHPCDTNQYLVWEAGELADFEIKLKSRVTGEGNINNGFQFRSRLLPDHDVCGYQVDNNLGTPWLVRLYDEYGRHDLALRGERTTLTAQGRTVAKMDEANGPAWFRLEDWHEYHLTCIGPQITLKIDGRLAAQVIDLDERRRELQGVFALQLHSGPPTRVQFKDIQLRELKKAIPPATDTFTERDPRRRALLEQALAHWILDTGGHGAPVPLRLNPAFYQFELNVKADGPGAHPNTKILTLDGAYLDAGPTLHAGPDQATVYLRARDPSGKWNGGLLAKRGNHEQVHLNLFSTDLEGTAGPDIGFEIRTDHGFKMVSFPVSQIVPDAWHDLVGCYDGRALTLYCDGKRMASTPCSGTMLTNSEPLLIGAETNNGQVVRHFHGELEEAAIWSRALTGDEVELLTEVSLTSQ